MTDIAVNFPITYRGKSNKTLKHGKKYYICIKSSISTSNRPMVLVYDSKLNNIAVTAFICADWSTREVGMYFTN